MHSLHAEMPAVRSFVSIPVFLVTMAGLTGCYDLSDPSGPRREDFMGDTNASEPAANDAQQPAQQTQAERSEQAAFAASRATTASEPAKDPHALPPDATGLQGLSVADYIARYIRPAGSSD